MNPIKNKNSIQDHVASVLKETESTERRVAQAVKGKFPPQTIDYGPLTFVARPIMEVLDKLYDALVTVLKKLGVWQGSSYYQLNENQEAPVIMVTEDNAHIVDHAEEKLAYEWDRVHAPILSQVSNQSHYLRIKGFIEKLKVREQQLSCLGVQFANARAEAEAKLQALKGGIAAQLITAFRACEDRLDKVGDVGTLYTTQALHSLLLEFDQDLKLKAFQNYEALQTNWTNQKQVVLDPFKSNEDRIQALNELAIISIGYPTCDQLEVEYSQVLERLQAQLEGATGGPAFLNDYIKYKPCKLKELEKPFVDFMVEAFAKSDITKLPGFTKTQELFNQVKNEGKRESILLEITQGKHLDLATFIQALTDTIYEHRQQKDYAVLVEYLSFFPIPRFQQQLEELERSILGLTDQSDYQIGDGALLTKVLEVRSTRFSEDALDENLAPNKRGEALYRLRKLVSKFPTEQMQNKINQVEKELLSKLRLPENEEEALDLVPHYNGLLEGLEPIVMVADGGREFYFQEEKLLRLLLDSHAKMCSTKVNAILPSVEKGPTHEELALLKEVALLRKDAPSERLYGTIETQDYTSGEKVIRAILALQPQVEAKTSIIEEASKKHSAITKELVETVKKLQETQKLETSDEIIQVNLETTQSSFDDQKKRVETLKKELRSNQLSLKRNQDQKNNLINEIQKAEQLEQDKRQAFEEIGQVQASDQTTTWKERGRQFVKKNASKLEKGAKRARKAIQKLRSRPVQKIQEELNNLAIEQLYLEETRAKYTNDLENEQATLALIDSKLSTLKQDVAGKGKPADLAAYKNETAGNLLQKARLIEKRQQQLERLLEQLTVEVEVFARSFAYKNLDSAWLRGNTSQQAYQEMERKLLGLVKESFGSKLGEEALKKIIRPILKEIFEAMPD